MHRSSTVPPVSVFYDYAVYPYRRPREMDGARATAPVIIVGAGPMGLVTALDLARFGVASIVLEQERQIAHGSRAIVLTRRSMEILQQIGVHQPFLAKGLPWSRGRSFYRGVEVYQMVMPHDEDDRFLPGLNLQQQYMEEFLVDRCRCTPLIDLRWGQKVVAVSQTDSAVTLLVDTPDGEYELNGDWVVAADGGRSTLRKLLRLRMEGRAYPGNFVIADIQAPINLPTERLCFFDPAWNPGNNVLVHRQPEHIWRIDFRLPDGETVEQALEPSLLQQRIDAVLHMIRQPCEWRLDWATVYSANTLTLSDFVHGRILFTGDAAHLLPIFGVRGANTGFQDCNNMTWKLAFVVNGWSDRSLLATYSSERVQAAREICEEGGRSTRFMTPPTFGCRLLRDAVLSFALSEDFLKELMHWRTSRPHSYHGSPLNSFAEADRAFVGGLACGQAVRNVKLGPDDYLLDHLGAAAGFVLMVFSGAEGLTDALKDVLTAAAKQPFPVVRMLISTRPPVATTAWAELVVADPLERVASRYGAQAGTVYLLRPDLHVCARWRRTDAAQVQQALRTAAGAH